LCYLNNCLAQFLQKNALQNRLILSERSSDMTPEYFPCYAADHPMAHRLIGIRRLFAVLFFLAVIVTNASASLLTDSIVGQISQTEYTSYVTRLQNYPTRYYNTAGNASALGYIRDEFLGYGLSVAYDPFTYGGTTYNNVVATLPGKTNPQNVYIVGAHMDSTSNLAATNAPGADDNASGMAAVLEMAKVLSSYLFDSTIKFIGFNVEEQGLIGSKAYVDDAKASGEHVLGMLNFDMIAYSGGSNSVYLAGNTGLVDALFGNAGKYTGLAPSRNYTNQYGSDHYYFHSSNFPGSTSAFAIEALPVNNSNYHKTTDTTSYLDFAYASDITRMGVATIADLAGVTAAVPEPSTYILAFVAGMTVWGAVVIRRKSRLA
jgi:hypothetical protein